MRDVIFTLLIFGLVPVSFRRPLVGLLTFSWLAYMRTQDLCWGFARHQRWSFLMAAVMGAGFMAAPREKLFEKDVRCWLMIGLVIWVSLSCMVSDGQDEFMWKRVFEFAKIIAISLFTTAVVRKPQHMRIMVWVIALSFGFYGIKVGLSGVLSLGRVQVLQGPGGMLEDNNDFSLALCMGLPLLIHIGATETNKHLRRGIWLATPLTALTVIMTHSRGGFLSLMAVFFMLMWRSRNRVMGFSLGAVAALVAFLVVPYSYIDRISTITSSEGIEKDGSAQGRLAAWRTAVNMSLGNPVFGVGLTHFEPKYNLYKTNPDELPRVTHNAYLQIWAESGTGALAMYLGLLFWTWWSLVRLRKESIRRYASSWITHYAAMFEVSIIAFIVGSTFLNRATFDLFYTFVALSVSLDVMARAEMAGTQFVKHRIRGPGGGGITVAERRGFDRLPRRGGFRPVPS
jgi:probable O-glycosylation ligase (exosortase A-associated)